MGEVLEQNAAAQEALEMTVAELRDELAGLRRAMRNRALIEQAKGVLVARLGLGPEQAFDHMLRLSQDTNTKVAVVAATVVGTATPDPALPETAPLLDDDLRTRLARARDSAGSADVAAPPRLRPPAAEALHTYHQILTARVAAARDNDELAEALAVATSGWPAPRRVVVAVLDPDGALRVVGADGLAAEERSQWTRLPPQVDVPMTRAVRQRAAVIAAEPATIKQDFPTLAELDDPPQAVAALPLPRQGRIVGAVGMGWPSPVDFGEDAERYLRALAGPVGSRIVELTGVFGDCAGDKDVLASFATWLPISLDAIHNPAIVLTPRASDGRVVDFAVVHANVHARKLFQQADLGQRHATVLSLFPYAGSRVLLAACEEVLRRGGLRTLDHVPVRPTDLGARGMDSVSTRVTRLGDQVLLVWRPRTAAELTYAQMLRAEQIARVGSLRCDLATGSVQLSPYLRRLLGRRRNERLDLDAIGEVVHEQDRPAARRLVRAVLAGGEPVGLDFRGTGRLAGRFLRVNVETVVSESGNAREVLGTVQDVTDERLLQARLRETERSLAEQRRAAELRTRLAEAMLPAPRPLTGRHVTARGACNDGRGAARAPGVWYDLCELPGGDVLLMVGSAVAAGTAATVGAGRVRHAIRSYALVHSGPAEILASANELVCFDRPGLRANVVLARYSPRGRCLRWAAAGQPAPIHYSGDVHGKVMPGPVGLPLGAQRANGYEETALAPAPGDRLLLYTDGLLQGLTSLTGAQQYAQPETVTGLVECLAHSIDGAHVRESCAVVARIS